MARLEFRDEEVYRKLNKTATCNFIKEVPFKGADEPVLSAKERMIAEMKAKFSAPIVPKKKGASGEDTKEDEELEGKYDKNMAWGTPRIVRKGDKDGLR